jgi:uncharacterized membrane protein YdbT with pleckstrin-like domain
LGFDKVVTANIGNPQQKGLDQRPITFWRQVSFRSKRRADGSRSEVQRFGARWKEKSREKREERRERRGERGEKREERREKREERREKREERREERGRREDRRLFFVIVHSSSIRPFILVPVFVSIVHSW